MMYFVEFRDALRGKFGFLTEGNEGSEGSVKFRRKTVFVFAPPAGRAINLNRPGGSVNHRYLLRIIEDYSRCNFAQFNLRTDLLDL